MQPDNPIVGGITLRIPAIRSPNYVAGSTGWTLNIDGTAELASVILRGFLEVDSPGGAKFVVGNQIPAAIATINGRTTIGGVIFELSATQFHYYVLVGPPFEVVRGTYDTTNGVKVFESSLVDPTSLSLAWGDASQTTTHSYSFSFFGCTLDIGGASPFAPSGTPFRIDGVEQGRGVRAVSAQTTSSSNVAAETVVIQSPNLTFYNGRAYRVEIGGGVFGNTASNRAVFAVREDGLGGLLLLSFTAIQTLATAGQVTPVTLIGYLSNTTGADIVHSLAVSLTPNVGTVAHYGAATLPRYVRVTDEGLASDNPQAAPIT